MARNDEKIDAYCWLYFEDKISVGDGGDEEFVATVDQTELNWIRGIEGVTVNSETLNTGAAKITLRASRSGQRNLAEARGVQTVQATARRDSLPVLIQLKRADRQPEHKGLENGSQLGSILSAMATQDALAALANDPNVVAVEISRGGVAECVHSMPWIGVPTVHAAPYSERGKGAIVAVIDTGFDVLHETFSDGGSSRFLYLWDQTGSGRRRPQRCQASSRSPTARFIRGPISPATSPPARSETG